MALHGLSVPCGSGGQALSETLNTMRCPVNRDLGTLHAACQPRSKHVIPPKAKRCTPLEPCIPPEAKADVAAQDEAGFTAVTWAAAAGALLALSATNAAAGALLALSATNAAAGALLALSASKSFTHMLPRSHIADSIIP